MKKLFFLIILLLTILIPKSVISQQDVLGTKDFIAQYVGRAGWVCAADFNNDDTLIATSYFSSGELKFSGLFS